jgi:sulfur carrier protein
MGVVRAFLKFNHKKDSGMEIKLNNQTQILQEKCSLQQLMDEFMPQKQKGIAIAVNQTVIPKANWQEHFLHSHDDVLIIRATQGG